MLQTEYVRSLQSNYAKLHLEQKPEEQRYQYCILSRGGIKGLLSCSLRYINGEAYLYYDITSKQSVAQLFGRKCIDRQWVKDFLWSMDMVRQELGRFLLDDRNLIWYPEQIYQDLEKREFSFLYIPYYDGERSFAKLLDFWIEHIDYEDDLLVECVYKMYEQYEQSGENYLDGAIYEDAKILDREDESSSEPAMQSCAVEEAEAEKCEEDSKKGIRYLFEGRKRKNKEARENYHQNMAMEMAGYAVAEDTIYDTEEYGRTIYIEETPSNEDRIHRLMTLDGRLLAQIDKPALVLGKKKDEVDVVLEGSFISRMHARIIKDKNDIYIEDLNSTNGTYRNGFRLLPYEKKKLEEGDELKFGKLILIYR